MANIKVQTIESAPERSKPILEGAKAKYGFVPNLLGVLSNSPAAVESYAKLSEIYGKSSLSPVEQQVVLLTVSYVNQCDYCMSAHSVIATNAAKMPKDVLDALRNGEKIVDAKLEALHTFTKTVVEKRGRLDQAQVKAFLTAGYKEAHVLEVIVGTALKTISNYTNHLAETPLDEAFASMKWEAQEAAVAA